MSVGLKQGHQETAGTCRTSWNSESCWQMEWRAIFSIFFNCFGGEYFCFSGWVAFLLLWLLRGFMDMRGMWKTMLMMLTG